MKRRAIFLIVTFVLFVASALFVLPQSETKLGMGYKSPSVILNKFMPWRLGLDLVGGSALLYDVDLSNVPKTEYDDVLNGLKDVIEKRVNLYGVSEPRVRTIEKGEKKQLLVELSGISDLDQAIKEIGATPLLDFRENCGEIEVGEGQKALACTQTELTGRHVSNAIWGYSEQGFSTPIVSLQFNEEGSKLFEQITERNIGKPLAIFLDGNLISAPLVNEKIAGGKAQISGQGITVQSARELAERFNAGALSAPISLVSRKSINATAASDSLNKIVFAGLVGTGLIVAFMIVMYGALGLVASLSLLFYAVITLAIFKLVPGFTMSLAGITGFILSLGGAVDANILIFERMKEEIKSGVGRVSAIENGFKYAWSSVRDSNISTMIIAGILYFFSSSFIKGFALTLLVGMAINLSLTYLVTKNFLKAVITGKN